MVNVLERFQIMMDTQAIDVVTFDLSVLVFSELSFDFKCTRVLLVVSGSTDYQMNFV